APALAGSIQLDFPRSDGANYVVYWNKTASIDGVVRIELGFANKYVDQIGEGGIKRYYAVKAKKVHIDGRVSAWIASTTLALGTAVSRPTPPVPTALPVQNTDSESEGQGYPKGAAVFEL